MSRESIPDPPRRPAMSLKPGPVDPVPEETARVAKAAFRRGSPLLKPRDELGATFADADFADLFPRRGRPGLGRSGTLMSRGFWPATRRCPDREQEAVDTVVSRPASGARVPVRRRSTPDGKPPLFGSRRVG